MNLISKLYDGYEQIVVENRNVILLTLIASIVLFVIMNSWHTISPLNQHDFKAYYYTTKVFDSGQNPYIHHNVWLLCQTPYGYAYHPYSLYYFKIFSQFSYGTALLFYMLCQVLLLILLVVIWQKYFLPKRPDILLFVIILIYAFNQTTFLALNAGNPAILEAFVVWLALLALTKNRPAIFLSLLIVISFIKGTPLALAPLVFLLPNKRRNLAILAGIISTGLLIWLSPLICRPEQFNMFWQFASKVKEFGIINPCFYALIGDVFAKILPGANWLADPIYLIWVVVVVSTAVNIIRKLNWSEHKIPVIFFSLLTYALVVPRFKDYAYLQLLPIAYFLSLNHPSLLVINLFSFFIRDLRLPYFFKEYIPYYALFINWLFLAHKLSPEHLKEFTTMFCSSTLERINRRLVALIIILVMPIILFALYQNISRLNVYVQNSSRPIEISDLVAIKADCGAHTLMANMNYLGKQMLVDNKIYSSGIYAHAPSELVFNLRKQFHSLETMAGILDTSGGHGSVIFKVLGDGALLYASPKISGNQKPIDIKVDLSNIDILTLIIDDLGERDSDHSAWLCPTIN